ncbi:Coronatine-insensitive protein [Salvia divinorum]|uniref:Coronatine-insensitive protein n=1 Tax=Salvia divinorum TaxID=28513 RepID=A0ABD1FUB7_SALDI
MTTQPRAPSFGDGDGGDTVWECVIPYARDRGAVSLVCKRWYEIDAITRKHVTMALCYTATPKQLSRRFPQLESLKIKGKPRAAMFNLIGEDWGGYAAPWVQEVAGSFTRMKALHFRRMIVSDSDLKLLATSAAGVALEVLKLDRCSGFSTDGLLHIGRACRNLRTLYIEESMITELDGEWLHHLALNNTVLENLNFFMTDLKRVRSEDIDLLARRCPSLTSVKISDCDISKLVEFFRNAGSLEEFAGGSVTEPPAQNGEEVAPSEQVERYSSISFPPKLCRLGLTYLGRAELPILFPIAAKLKKLDLLYAMLDTEGHCQILQTCPNLEVLEARNVLGDRGLEVLARCCKSMKRLRIERGADEQDMEDVEGVVSQRGLIALAQGCLELEYIAVYVSDITNAALECMATHSKNLCDFRFALYLRKGGLTDVGLGYIGQYSPKVTWMLLGYVGESDAGLLEFSKGCPSLQKLEMRGCCFSERALATAALRLPALRYLWVQGYSASSDGRDLLAMARPNWNIELIPATRHIVHDAERQRLVIVEDPAHILAYCSLAGQRTDFPSTVIPLDASASRDP